MFNSKQETGFLTLPNFLMSIAQFQLHSLSSVVIFTLWIKQVLSDAIFLKNIVYSPVYKIHNLIIPIEMSITFTSFQWDNLSQFIEVLFSEETRYFMLFHIFPDMWLSGIWIADIFNFTYQIIKHALNNLIHQTRCSYMYTVFGQNIMRMTK